LILLVFFHFFIEIITIKHPKILIERNQIVMKKIKFLSLMLVMSLFVISVSGCTAIKEKTDELSESAKETADMATLALLHTTLTSAAQTANAEARDTSVYEIYNEFTPISQIYNGIGTFANELKDGMGSFLPDAKDLLSKSASEDGNKIYFKIEDNGNVYVGIFKQPVTDISTPVVGKETGTVFEVK